MASPTVEEMLSWPTPNYDDPETLDSAVFAVNSVCIVLMTVFVAGRFWSRTVIVKGALATDDWIMLVAYILCIGITILHMVEMNFGIGRHLYDVKFEWLDRIGKLSLITQTLFGPAAAVTKVSICFTYLRLFPSRTNKWFCYITIVILIGFALSTTLVMCLQCTPLNDLWNVMKSMAQKNCVNIMIFFVWVAAMNAMTDVLVYLWPLHYLWTVQMPTGKRIGLCISFGVGVVICIAGFFRIWQVVAFFDSWDQTWNGTIVYLIVTVEISLGVICGCLPGIRPLMSQLFPKLFGTMSNSSNGYGSNGKGGNRSNTSGHKSRRGFRGLKEIEVTKDVELAVHIQKNKFSDADKQIEPRLGSGYTRNGSQDWIIPNPTGALGYR